MTLFVTPENERSFSALVDRIMRETGHVSAFLSVAGWVNQTVRECQALGLFVRDLVEDVVTVPDANPRVWTRPQYFRSLKAFKFNTSGMKPVRIVPGMSLEEYSYWWYAADDYYVFGGMYTGEGLGVAAYYWAKPLRYYAKLGEAVPSSLGGPYAVRPAYFDIDTDAWMYLNDAGTAYVSTLGSGQEAVEALRRRNAMNWLIQDWWDMIKDGAKAKVFQSKGDPRSNAAFANYKNGQNLLRMTVGFEVEA